MNPIWKVSWFLIVKLWDKYSQVCRCCVSWYSKGCSNSRWTPWTSEWGRDVLTFCLVFTFIERYLGFIEPAAVLLSSVPPVRGEITLFCVESNRQHMIWIVNLINMNYVTIRQLNQSCSMDSRYKNSYGRILVHWLAKSVSYSNEGHLFSFFRRNTEKRTTAPLCRNNPSWPQQLGLIARCFA